MTDSTLWLTNRSAYQREHNQCDHARFLEYHSGPYGYGIRLKAESVYLPTGIFFHKILEGVVKLAIEIGWKDFEASKYRADTRVIINGAVDRYYRLLDARGLRNMDLVEQEYTIAEQATLIEGLGWAWSMTLLPYLIKYFTPLSVEVEDVVVLGCSCGLPTGVGEPEDHATRGCNGIAWCSKADLITARDADGAAGWHEYKTGAEVFRKTFSERWDTNVQFASGILGAERRLQREITHIYVHGLQKGSRKSQYDDDKKDYSGPRRQNSILCYAYCKPADPPVLPLDDWRVKYQWYENDPHTGKRHMRRLGKGYEKVPIWEAEFFGRPGGWSNVEYWTAWLGPIRMNEEVCLLLGPYERPTQMLEEFVVEAAAEERRWQDRLWAVHDARTQAYDRLMAARPVFDESGSRISFEVVEVQPEVQKALRENFPKNWEGCRSYYGDVCEFLDPICLKRVGWDDPLGSLKYIHRRPHHQPEIDQMIARGLPVPTDPDAEEGIDDDGE